MNKNLKLFTILGLSLSTIGFVTMGCSKKESKDPFYYVDFFSNYLREEFILSNDYKGKGNNIIYKTLEVAPDALVEKPEDPTRRNYNFEGWFKEKECATEWDFASEKVTKNTRLYAKWAVGGKGDIVEPEYTPPSTVLEDSAPTDYVVNSVMYFPVKDGQVKLPTASLNKLEAQKTDVLPLMEYKVKNGKEFSATFDTNKITITCNDSSEQITVINNSTAYTLSDSNYESKAKKYEAKYESEDIHHIMLAGSSSIEFWESSTEDLDPLVSYNHGIGGTTIEQWNEKLNQRLVFPYKPKMVVYYVGINNVINSKQSSTTIWNNLEKFFNDTHAALPDTKVQYIMMNLIPGFPDYFTVINNVNAKVVEYQQNNPWLTLINPGLALLKENGQPNAAYFRTDGLHLSNYGYVIWGGIIKDAILQGLENL